MRPMGHDSLSSLLRRGDPAKSIAEAPPDAVRRAALLARCKEEAGAETVAAPVQGVGRGSGRWVFGGGLAVASLLLLGLFVRPPQSTGDGAGTVAVVTPATPLPVPSPAVAVKGTKKSIARPGASSVRATVGGGMGPKPVLALPSPEPRTEQKRRMRRYLAQGERAKSSRAERRGPSLVASGKPEKGVGPVIAPRPAPKPVPEPIVERIIVIGDETPLPPTPPVETIAIILSGKTQAAITSRPDASDTSL